MQRPPRRGLMYCTPACRFTQTGRGRSSAAAAARPPVLPAAPAARDGTREAGRVRTQACRHGGSSAACSAPKAAWQAHGRLHGTHMARCCWPPGRQVRAHCPPACKHMASPHRAPRATHLRHLHRRMPPAYLQPRLAFQLLRVAVEVEHRACSSVKWARMVERQPSGGPGRRRQQGKPAGAPARSGGQDPLTQRAADEETKRVAAQVGRRGHSEEGCCSELRSPGWPACQRTQSLESRGSGFAEFRRRRLCAVLVAACRAPRAQILLFSCHCPQLPLPNCLLPHPALSTRTMKFKVTRRVGLEMQVRGRAPLMGAARRFWGRFQVSVYIHVRRSDEQTGKAERQGTGGVL